MIVLDELFRAATTGQPPRRPILIVENAVRWDASKAAEPFSTTLSGTFGVDDSGFELLGIFLGLVSAKRLPDETNQSCC